MCLYQDLPSSRAPLLSSNEDDWGEARPLLALSDPVVQYGTETQAQEESTGGWRLRMQRRLAVARKDDT